jgi:hypothetical protein
VSYVSTYRPSLSIKLRVEVPHYVPLNRDFIRNDMAIKWLPGGRSGDSQIKTSKMQTGVSNRHFFPCAPKCMSSRAAARDLLILQLSSHICNFATSSLVPPKCMSSRAAARDLLILQILSHFSNSIPSSLLRRY